MILIFSRIWNSLTSCYGNLSHYGLEQQIFMRDKVFIFCLQFSVMYLHGESSLTPVLCTSAEVLLAGYPGVQWHFQSQSPGFVSLAKLCAPRAQSSSGPTRGARNGETEREKESRRAGFCPQRRARCWGREAENDERVGGVKRR